MIVGPAGAAALAALHQACFPPGARWDEQSMRSLLAMPGCFGWIEAVDGKPRGMALARVAADEAELLTICVPAAERRSGHGAAIMRTVCAEAARLGAARLFLEVAVENGAATGLYRRLGFAEAGRRACYYPDGGDALVMAACLPLAEESRRALPGTRQGTVVPWTP